MGSLPRPGDLIAPIVAKEKREPYDRAAFEARLTQAVAEIVAQQHAIGIDVVCDGEIGKPSFVSYVNSRLSGFEIAKEERPLPWGRSREALEFPDYYTPASRPQGAGVSAGYPYMICTGPIGYVGHDELERDLANLGRAVAAAGVAEAFMPSISTTNIAEWHDNAYYDSEEAFLYGIADAMRAEYQAIIEAGFLLQIDDPRLATHYALHPEKSVEDCRRWAAVRIEALNHALKGLPAERIRYHTCYSINIGPRVHDMELKHFVDLLLTIHAGALSFEAANPRHEHEWQVWETVDLPEGLILIPGVITHSNVMVEHPETVAQRIARFADAVGRERIIAGADCGFGSFATATPEILPSIVWRKLEALVEGARLASESLWSA